MLVINCCFPLDDNADRELDADMDSIVPALLSHLRLAEEVMIRQITRTGTYSSGACLNVLVRGLSILICHAVHQEASKWPKGIINSSVKEPLAG